jgi:hypothetical protein
MMRQVVLFHIRQVPLGYPHVVRKVVYHVVQHVCSVVGRPASTMPVNQAKTRVTQ